MQVVCHRGANALAPENTLPAATPCIAWGADFLEIDVNTSSDGVMYVFHGPDLERTTNGTGKIYQRDSSYIDSLDCGSWFDERFAGERMPRLDEFVGWLDGRIKLFLDVKWAPLPELVGLLGRHKMLESCFFWFGRSKLAGEFRRLNPNLQLKINAETVTGVHSAVRDFSANIIECQFDDDVEGVVSACRSLGLQSMVKYDGRDPEIFRRIKATGADLINLDHADVFFQSVT